VSETTGKPISHPSSADPRGYGLGVQQETNRQTGIFWVYEGQAFCARVIHMYFPRSGIIIAVAANSSTNTSDDLSDLADSVYETLQHAGAIPAS
jgi:D-alanyl-D-alanine carboxypeptidase